MRDAARVIAAARRLVEEVAAAYPENVFPPDSTTPDAFAAKGARVACREILRRLAEYDTASELVFTHVANDFWDVNDSATVAKSTGGTWAYCHPGTDGWVPGFISREAAGQAALDAIRAATQ